MVTAGKEVELQAWRAIKKAACKGIKVSKLETHAWGFDFRVSRAGVALTVQLKSTNAAIGRVGFRSAVRTFAEYRELGTDLLLFAIRVARNTYEYWLFDLRRRKLPQCLNSYSHQCTVGEFEKLFRHFKVGGAGLFAAFRGLF